MLRNFLLDTSPTVWDAVRREPLWGLAVLAAISVAMAFRRPIGRVLAKLGRHLFQAACILLFLILLVGLVDELLGPAPDTKAAAALGATLLVLAFGAQSGQHLLTRIKKIGPLELFELRASEIIEVVREVLDEVDVEIGNAALTPRAQQAYGRTLALVRHVEFSGATPTSDRELKRYGDLLLKCAQLAGVKGDWWVAQWALLRVRSLLGKRFEATKVAYNLGKACYRCASSVADGQDLRRRALANFARATRLDPFDAESHFWLAFVQHDLGMFGPAILTYQKVLELASGTLLATKAKYNIVASRIKQGKLDEALADLLEIKPQNQVEWNALFAATEDPDLRPLLADSRFAAQARWWLQRLSDPTAWDI